MATRPNSNAVISDLLIGTVDLSDDDFARLLTSGSAVGYDPFKPFIGGEYEYNKALYKGVLTTVGSTPRLLGLSVGVDVPDVHDSGVVVTSATALTHVTFNRHFNAPPEIVPMMKGGSIVAIARASNVTQTGFDVELVDAAGSRVVGTVSWAAKGY